MTRTWPERSVTSILPSGRNARLHGCDRPFVTTTTRNGPSTLLATVVPSGRGTLGKRPTCCAVIAAEMHTRNSIALFNIICLRYERVSYCKKHRDTKAQRLSDLSFHQRVRGLPLQRGPGLPQRIASI